METNVMYAQLDDDNKVYKVLPHPNWINDAGELLTSEELKEFGFYVVDDNFPSVDLNDYVVELNDMTSWTVADGVVKKTYTVKELSQEEKYERFPTLTARQLRLGLSQLGKLSQVEAAFNLLPVEEKETAMIEWEYASTFTRTNPLLIKVMTAIGLTSTQVDPVWLEFSKK